MIPLRDTIPSRRFPITNVVLIVINVVVFLAESTMRPVALERLIVSYGLTPVLFWQGGWLSRWPPVFASMFLHIGWWHMISNMLALYVFGDNVEDRLGHIGYLAFYVLSGVAAAMAQMLVSSRSFAPMVGASGAIAGVLGAYILLYPRARVLTLVPIFFFRAIQVPAVVYLGFWFISQLFNGFLALGVMGAVESGGVAWFAHIGGFVFGLAIAGFLLLFARLRRAQESQAW